MRVMIDPGHGGQDPGAVFKGVMEKDINLAVGKMLAGIVMAQPGCEVALTRGSDLYVPIGSRANKAHIFGADLFVSVHMNADPDDDSAGMPEARGGEVWIFPGSLKGRRLAELIAERIRETFPDEPFRGVKEEAFGVLRLTKMPACLVEMAFIDNSETVRTMTDPKVQDQMAGAIANGIIAYAA